MQVRQLKDGRWQVIRDDGVCFSLTYEQWQALMAQIERAQTKQKRPGSNPLPRGKKPAPPPNPPPNPPPSERQCCAQCDPGEDEWPPAEPKQDQEMPYTVACRCGKLWINLDADERYCRSCGFDLIGDPVESDHGPTLEQIQRRMRVEDELGD